jgi:hypothetical protein
MGIPALVFSVVAFRYEGPDALFGFTMRVAAVACAFVAFFLMFSPARKLYRDFLKFHPDEEAKVRSGVAKIQMGLVMSGTSLGLLIMGYLSEQIIIAFSAAIVALPLLLVGIMFAGYGFVKWSWGFFRFLEWREE